ncbi:hypothetical protein RFI_17365 [Reticulomyxa filosa]|uniref:Uncharacterized protein n=1 Tax=Reticulomyxa filosa TaxID=46433 RepID=X6N3I2_RETFI|nr:hypothetical protein RFI_17365 [Reticulomyxa filosa]|eukprot:ETO19857.1 hypothetical protein RFI_17365 [Reticulomyxa filosa]
MSKKDEQKKPGEKQSEIRVFVERIKQIDELQNKIMIKTSEMCEMAFEYQKTNNFEHILTFLDQDTTTETLKERFLSSKNTNDNGNRTTKKQSFEKLNSINKDIQEIKKNYKTFRETQGEEKGKKISTHLFNLIDCKTSGLRLMKEIEHYIETEGLNCDGDSDSEKEKVEQKNIPQDEKTKDKFNLFSDTMYHYLLIKDLHTDQKLQKAFRLYKEKYGSDSFSNKLIDISLLKDDSFEELIEKSGEGLKKFS